MQKSRLHVRLPAATFTAVNNVAQERCQSLTSVVNDLLVAAMSRPDEQSIDPAALNELEAKVATLVDRTYYLIIATNVMLEHRPEADLKLIVEAILRDKKAVSTG